MSSIGENGDVDTIREWEGKYIIKHYSGKYFFLEELGLSEPQMYAWELRCNEGDARLVVENIYPIPLPAQQLTDALGNTKKYLPTITWVDEVGEIIVVKTLDWVGVYNFRKGKLLSECKCDNVCCALTVDEKLILGCSPGLMVEYMGQGDGLITL